jgi:Signal transduction histidine kinase
VSYMNKFIKKFIFYELLMLFVIVIITLIFSIRSFNDYEEKLLENNAYIVSAILDKHPELQDDILSAILDSNKDIDNAILERYGLTKEILDFNSFHISFRNNLIRTNIIAISLSMVILIISFVVFYYNEQRKIKSISKYMNEILNDNYALNIRDYGNGYISDLKNDIYKVTIKLKEQSDLSIKDKKNLEETLSDISHQLRTPLTSMYVINDLLKTDIDDKTRKEFLQKNYVQLERIEWLIASLLKMSRLDSGVVKLDIKKFKVLDVIERAIETLKIPMELKNIDLVIECNEDIKILVDLSWTAEALLNIIKNAMEHSEKKSIIKIEVIDNPIYTEIKIIDNGEGIRKEDIGHIFERFYKVNNSKESIGIGLNMAKKIIDLEKGDISVNSKIGKGTTFSVKFYKNVI